MLKKKVKMLDENNSFDQHFNPSRSRLRNTIIRQYGLILSKAESQKCTDEYFDIRKVLTSHSVADNTILLSIIGADKWTTAVSITNTFVAVVGGNLSICSIVARMLTCYSIVLFDSTQHLQDIGPGL